MEKVVAVIQARMSSRRLPHKIALDLYGQPLLERVIRQVQRSRLVDTIVVATSVEHEDTIVELICRRMGVVCFRGSLDDVRSRFIDIGRQTEATILVRVTADNPLTDAHYTDTLISFITTYAEVDYCIMDKTKVPIGTQPEVFRFQALLDSAANDDSAYSKEHVTPGVIASCRVSTLEPESVYTLGGFSVSIDTFDDYLNVNKLYSRYKGQPELKQLIVDVRRERQQAGDA